MGLYTDHILPRGVAWTMGGARMAPHRADALAGTRGRVLELGFGAGHNLVHYPEAVREVLALEPAVLNRRLARRRIGVSRIPVRWVGLRGEEIPLETGSVDCVVSTWTLCTIPGLSQALGEVKRVLAPGGSLHFVEHGLCPEARVARWQHRLNPIQKFWAGGCHLNRRFDQELEAAGFSLEQLENYFMDGPRFLSYLYRGVAVPKA